MAKLSEISNFPTAPPHEQNYQASKPQMPSFGPQPLPLNLQPPPPYSPTPFNIKSPPQYQPPPEYRALQPIQPQFAYPPLRPTQLPPPPPQPRQPRPHPQTFAVLTRYGPKSQNIICPHCQTEVWTKIEAEPSTLSYVICAALFFTG